MLEVNTLKGDETKLESKVSDITTAKDLEEKGKYEIVLDPNVNHDTYSEYSHNMVARN